jgi:UDP-N-acetylenolpyruvoylglucosamine reductase
MVLGARDLHNTLKSGFHSYFGIPGTLGSKFIKGVGKSMRVVRSAQVPFTDLLSNFVLLNFSEV